MAKGSKGSVEVCSRESCDRTDLSGWGLCGKHYQQWWKSGAPRPEPEPWPDVKGCSLCGEIKSLSEFFSQKQGGRFGVTTRCRVCIRRTMAERRAMNPDREREIGARYRHGKEALRATKMRAYYWANREQRMAYGRKYRVLNRAQLAARMARWVRANPERIKANASTRSARKRNAVGMSSVEQIKQRFRLFGYRCWICGGDATSLDHVKPLAKGGSNWPANLRPACKSCNSRKRSRWLGADRVNELAQTIRLERFNDARRSLATLPSTLTREMEPQP